MVADDWDASVVAVDQGVGLVVVVVVVDRDAFVVAAAQGVGLVVAAAQGVGLVVAADQGVGLDVVVLAAAAVAAQNKQDALHDEVVAADAGDTAVHDAGAEPHGGVVAVVDAEPHDASAPADAFDFHGAHAVHDTVSVPVAPDDDDGDDDPLVVEEDPEWRAHPRDDDHNGDELEHGELGRHDVLQHAVGGPEHAAAVP
jgi:hypothetical protein